MTTARDVLTVQSEYFDHLAGKNGQIWVQSGSLYMSRWVIRVSDDDSVVMLVCACVACEYHVVCIACMRSGT